MQNYFKILGRQKIQWMFYIQVEPVTASESEYILIKSRAISRWHHTAKTTVFDYVRQSAIRIQRNYRGVLGRKFQRLKAEFCIQEQLRIAKWERSIEKVYISSEDHQTIGKCWCSVRLEKTGFVSMTTFILNAC